MKIKKRGLLVVLLLVCLLGLVGCGGGGSNSGTTPPGTTPPILTLKSEAELDGYILHMFKEPVEYLINNSPYTIDVGYSTSGLTKIGSRGFVSFNLSSLPDGATITSAVLRVYQYYINDGNGDYDPYEKLGKIIVDHVSYDSLPHADNSYSAQAKYEMAPFATAGILSADSKLEYKILDVTAAVQADLAESRERSQFRLRFEKEIVEEDIYSSINVYFYSGERGTNPPELVIQYTK